MEITPAQLNEWIPVLWSIGWKGLIVFAVIYYREAVIHIIKTILDIIGSWLKRR